MPKNNSESECILNFCKLRFVFVFQAKSILEIFQVYSGPYLTPDMRERASTLNVARNSGQWPIKKVLKERINQRTVSHKSTTFEFIWFDKLTIIVVAYPLYHITFTCQYGDSKTDFRIILFPKEVWVPLWTSLKKNRIRDEYHCTS